ncbi:MAG: ATP-dependent Clp protease adaptor ClpS [Bacteroidota bacterium]|nr:ATP-dependent Clp protease adaptor ClpS [Bacteroidota bacterium]MDX5431627.1 ATP-dependent Clp protease adaptor ClpS [Bacteroidota bacterium]MDX5470345.1 ATP-dependent Clp protease adaptor ClpS [Bacteroidota bacterium]
MIRFGGQIEYEEDVLLDELLTETRKLVLYNDDVNTFDHVIECLMDICKHEMHQAEQCALLVHFKGKAIVKEGEEDTLRIMCEGLLDKGLSAVME